MVAFGTCDRLPVIGKKTTPNHERSFRALYELSVQASGVLDVAQLAQMAVDQVRDLVDADRVGIWVWDAAADLLIPLRVLVDNSWELVPIRRGDSLIAETFYSRKPALIRDYANYRSAYGPSKLFGIATAMAVPLIHGNDAIGVLLADSKSADAFVEDDLRLLSLFAAQLAPALQAAQHHADSEARRAEAEGLATLMRLAASSTHVKEVLDAVVSTASSLTGADYTRIALNEQGKLGEPDSAR